MTKPISPGDLTLPREVASGVYWLSTCLVLGDGVSALHTHNSAFLVRGDRGAVLIDTGLPSGWPQLRAQLMRALDGRPLTHLLPTHPEIPHFGNLERLARDHPDARIVGDMRNFHLFHPALTERCEHVAAEGRIELGGRTVRIVDAAIRDLPNTRWAFDERTATLFTSDAFAYSHPHRAGECGLCSDEIGSRPTLADARFVIEQALHWPAYVDPVISLRRLENCLRRWPPRAIGPAHGGFVTEPGRLLDIYTRALSAVYTDARAPAS